MVEKGPVKSKFVRNVTFIFPKIMATDPEKTMQRFSVILEMLVLAK